jgi:hypothetical protein
MRGAAAFHLEGLFGDGARKAARPNSFPALFGPHDYLIGATAGLASSLKRGATHDRRSPHPRRPPRLWLLVEPTASPCHKGK